MALPVTPAFDFSGLFIDFTILDASGGGGGGGGGGTGTVTSVGMSGGTTGLTVTGSPVTTSGAFVLHLANGSQLAGRNAADNADVGLIGVDASDRIAIGSIVYLDQVNDTFRITENATNPDRGFSALSITAANAGGNFVAMRAGGVIGAPTIIPDTNSIANFSAMPYDGVNYLRTGIMRLASMTGCGVNHIPTVWGLYLSDGSIDAIQTPPKITVNDQGNVVIRTATSGRTLQVGPLTYPEVDGTAGQVMQTDGAGNLSLGNVSGALAISSVWSAQVVTRTLGTAYQNTSGKTILVMCVVQSSSTNTTLAGFTDSSNPPTTQVAAATTNTFGGANVTSSIAIFVKNNDFYKITSTGGTPSIMSTREYTITKGSITDSGDLSGSKAYATTYQNTSGSLMIVQIQIGTGGMTSAQSDASSPPTVQVDKASVQNSGNCTMFFPVLNGHYYQITNNGTGSIVKWHEYTWSGVSVQRSNPAATRIAADGIQSTNNSLASYSNNSLASVMSSVAVHSTGAGTLHFYNEPLSLDGVFTQSVATNSFSWFTSASAGPVVHGFALVNNAETFNVNFDVGAVTVDNWLEWRIS